MPIIFNKDEPPSDKREESMRETIARVIDEVRSGESPRFSLAAVIVFVLTECTGIPLCIAGGDGAAHSELFVAAIGWGFGLPLALMGFTFPFWGHRLRVPIENWVRKYTGVLLPVAVLLAFAYVVGPNIYQRAVAPTPMAPPSLPTSAPQAHDPLDFRVCYDEKPCPTAEESAKRRAFVDELISASNYAPDTPRHIRIVAEESGTALARLLINLCATAQWPLLPDKATGGLLHAPMSVRLDDGVTIRAPAESATAESIRVALAAYGIKAKRLGPLPYMGDYVDVEVGRIGN